jgi:hypothetical protein
VIERKREIQTACALQLKELNTVYQLSGFRCSPVMSNMPVLYTMLNASSLLHVNKIFTCNITMLLPKQADWLM